MKNFQMIKVRHDPIRFINPIQITDIKYHFAEVPDKLGASDYGDREVLSKKDDSVLRIRMYDGQEIVISGDLATEVYNLLIEMDLMSDTLREKLRA